VPISAPPRGANPFDSTGVQRDENGVRRYAGLDDSLVAMLRAAVDAQPQAEALVELGGVDDQGLVYVLDRIKDMINRGGENVYSVEVENRPDRRSRSGRGRGRRRRRPDDGREGRRRHRAVAGSDRRSRAVVAYARDRLADFKVPQFIAVRNDPLPRNPNGKVLKAALRETDFAAPLF
jgi:hypothetical protein